MEQSTPIHTFGVAGGGANINSASIAFGYIRAHLTERAIPFTPIHGVERNIRAEQRVRPASEQFTELTSHIDTLNPDTKILLIAQCLGAIASLSALEHYQGSRPIALTVFSPPLPTPEHTISQPKSRDKRSMHDTQMRIIDFAPGKLGDFSQLIESSAIIPPRYLADIYDAHDLAPRLNAAASIGRAAIFGTSHDWNNQSPVVITNWMAANPTLPAWVLGNTGHSLNPVNPGLTKDQKAQRQQENCAFVVDTGLSLL